MVIFYYEEDYFTFFYWDDKKIMKKFMVIKYIIFLKKLKLPSIQIFLFILSVFSFKINYALVLFLFKNLCYDIWFKIFLMLDSNI